MATNIDELVVRIKADTKQLNKALDKVKKKTKETGDSGKKGFSGMAASLGKVKGPLWLDLLPKSVWRLKIYRYL